MAIDLQRIKSSKEMQALVTCTADRHTHQTKNWFNRKLSLLIAIPKIKKLFLSDHWLNSRWTQITLGQKLCLLSLIAIDQEHLFAIDPSKVENGEKKWSILLKCLEYTEDFYADMGGIIGYHTKVIDLLTASKGGGQKQYLPPPKIDCSQRTPDIEGAIEIALKKWENTGLILPAGGAGDRLNLLGADKRPLPAAFLKLGGKTLLEAIICDLEGYEHAAFKLTGKRVLTPIAIMTSDEKDNHALISKYLEDQNWFERPKETFRLFRQPSVPVISAAGVWVANAPLQLLTKPGGHGVLWRLANRSGIFDWFDRLGCQKAIVRQINNCLAASDIGLLTLAGWGWRSGKSMGFTSCARARNMAEGVNAVVQKSCKDGYSYTLENIEYNELPDDFEQTCKAPESYFANVNLLFVDLKTLRALSSDRPLPGLTVNFKTLVKTESNNEPVLAGRLESTMQNISSHLVFESQDKLEEIGEKQLLTYAIFCERNKILSAAKRIGTGTTLIETPEMAYLDLQRRDFDLLKSCGFCMPTCEKRMPSAIVTLHPALGPDWHITAQKIRGGCVKKKSNLELEIAELDIENLQLNGSLQIISTIDLPITGPKKPTQTHHRLQGRCSLKNVFVENRGIGELFNCDYWSQPPQLLGSLKIILNGQSEFCAENVTLRGSQTIHVPAGFRVMAHKKGSEVIFRQTPLDGMLWNWNYQRVKGRWHLRRICEKI